jgi:biopolymer transport protein TolR
MLVLLVIFMMTTPILEQGIEVDLPNADTKAVDFTGATTAILACLTDAKPIKECIIPHTVPNKPI